MKQMHAPPIELTSVTKTFGQIRALDNASFSLAAGDRTCLLGPNGAGKTTLIRLLTGALNPTGGVARIYGVAAQEPAFLAAKRRVGIVPQAPGMYRDMPVQEYLQLVRQLYGRGNIEQVVEVFGLQAYVDRPMAQLSGGYQRRLVLAAALLPEPDLLLLDEPTVGLDPVAARDVLMYLQTMMKGRTTLLCTHNLAEAEALCEDVVILRQGRVLLHAPISQLRARVQPQLVLAAQEGPERLVDALNWLGYQPSNRDGTVQIGIADPQTSAPDLLRRLLEAGLNVYECHTLRPRLEDLFLDIVGEHDDRA